MAEIAIILDILRKNPSPSTVKALHSSGYFSAKAAASAAAGAPYAYNELLGNFRTPVVYCDTGTAWSEDCVSSSPSASQRIFANGFLNNYNNKQYKVELKPLFSAVEWRALAVTTFKSFVSFFALVHRLKPCSRSKDDDDLSLDSEKEEQHVADYVVPLKKSVKQILRDTTVVTTRRILERISVHYVSRRTACKLLKDVPKSAMRKSVVILFSVVEQPSEVLATWLIEVGIEINRFISHMIRSREEDDDDIDLGEQLKILGKKVSGTSIRCGALLAFGSIGAGIGATLIRPSMGQHIGCVVGESAGPAIVSYCLGKFAHAEP